MHTHSLSLMFTAIALGVSGCAGLPDTTLGHRCGIPDGVGCLSTQEVYDRATSGELPGLERSGESLEPSLDAGAPAANDTAPRWLRTSALYAPPEELRIWVNRWRDADGDLHEDAFLYVLIGDGQWLVRD